MSHNASRGGVGGVGTLRRARCSDCGWTTSTSAPVTCTWGGRWGAAQRRRHHWPAQVRSGRCGRFTCRRAPPRSVALCRHHGGHCCCLHEVMARGGWSHRGWRSATSTALWDESASLPTPLAPLDALSRSVREGAKQPPMTADDRGRSRTCAHAAQRDVCQTRKAQLETDSDRAVSRTKCAPRDLNPKPAESKEGIPRTRGFR
jgi:hypothetical protein